MHTIPIHFSVEPGNTARVGDYFVQDKADLAQNAFCGQITNPVSVLNMICSPGPINGRYITLETTTNERITLKELIIKLTGVGYIPHHPDDFS